MVTRPLPNTLSPAYRCTIPEIFIRRAGWRGCISDTASLACSDPLQYNWFRARKESMLIFIFSILIYVLHLIRNKDFPLIRTLPTVPETWVYISIQAIRNETCLAEQKAWIFGW